MSLSNVDKWIKSIQETAREIPKGLPKEVSKVVRSDLRNTVKGGNAPTGEAWEPSKGGQRILKRAHRAIMVKPSKTDVKVEVKGHYVWHHNGTSRTPQRRLIPFGTIPPKLSQVIKETIEKWFKEHLGT